MASTDPEVTINQLIAEHHSPTQYLLKAVKDIQLKIPHCKTTSLWNSLNML